MKRISILDCTLRDGGYINSFNFGSFAIKDIIRKLTKASIDIIECGFLKSKANDPDKSLFGSVKDIQKVIEKKNPNLVYVAMIQYGAISIDEVPVMDGTSIDGIRLTFHEHEIEESFELGQQLMNKGYKVFMQPVGTTTYTDTALLQLIDKVNRLRPFAFYLVDTLGVMYKNDLLRMYYLVDHNLDKSIVLGFHSHNNLQLSFANAQELMQLNTSRRLIIDTSILGMGRGAGNLNTELVTQYINTNFGLQYDNLEILEIIDQYIRPIRSKYSWGYDAPYYIASINGCHPNFATFLIQKHTLHIQDIQAILSRLDPVRKSLFDRPYIEQQYYQYQDHLINDKDALNQIHDIIGDKEVILIAPGKSLRNRGDEVNGRKGEHSFLISINFIPKDIQVDAVFCSNIRRFASLEELSKQAEGKCIVIVTSNVVQGSQQNIIIVNYASYTNEEPVIVDNAGLMCINLMKKIGVESITLAGFDGFSEDVKDNYYDPSLRVDVEAERLMRMNQATSRKLSMLSTQLKIQYLDNTAYKTPG